MRLANIFVILQYLQRSSRVMQLSPDGKEVILAYDVAPVSYFNIRPVFPDGLGKGVSKNASNKITKKIETKFLHLVTKLRICLKLKFLTNRVINEKQAE